METYSDAFDLATRLPHWMHWLLCVAFCFVWIMFENPSSLVNHGVFAPVIFCSIGGLIFSVISRLMMGIIPWFYAGIARQLPTSWLIDR